MLKECYNKLLNGIIQKRDFSLHLNYILHILDKNRLQTKENEILFVISIRYITAL